MATSALLRLGRRIVVDCAPGGPRGVTDPGMRTDDMSLIFIPRRHPEETRRSGAPLGSTSISAGSPRRSAMIDR
ncbi:MAG: hypothetical protein ACJAVS_002774 [Paracoccaceae bacterium]|jgi:hypothetical protein